MTDGNIVISNPPPRQDLSVFDAPVGAAAAAHSPQASPHGPGGHSQVNILAVVHSLLRGRYWLAIPLTAIGVITGVLLGYMLPTPKFRAEGQLRVQPIMPRILYNTEQTAIPMWQSFIATQAALVEAPPVINRALRSDAWRALRRPPSNDPEAEFREALNVRVSPQSQQLIVVQFTDTDGRTAMTAVQEVVRAYMDLYGAAEARDTRETTRNILEQRKREMETQLRTIDERLRTITAGLESSDVTRLHDHSLEQLLDVEKRVMAVRQQLAALGVDPAVEPSTPPPSDPAATTDVEPKPEPMVSPTAEQLAETNQELAGLLRTLREMDISLESMRARGMRDAHPSVSALLTRRAAFQAQIDAIVAKAEPIPARSARAKSVAKPGPDGVTVSVPQLLLQLRILNEQSAGLRRRTEDLSKRRIAVDAEIRERRSVEADLQSVMRRLDEVNLESQAADRMGRIEPILPTAPPSSPNADPRTRMAAVGLVVGGGVPVALMLLVGLIDRRLRYSDQTDEGAFNVPLLGLLPELPPADADADQLSSARHAVHQLRTRLELHGEDRPVFAVTSPSAGDGKTTLSIALAMSFAAAGRATLLVDFDLIGHGTSSSLGGWGADGIGRDLSSGQFSSLPRDTGIPRLALLGAGIDDASLVGQIPADRFRRLIADLRARFDVIIIDTGPILGSLEANIASASADGTLLVVGRGQSSRLVKAAVSHLRSLGARVRGIVFNRAGSADFRHSTVSGSFRSVRDANGSANGTAHHHPKAHAGSTQAALKRLDPLCRSIASETMEDEATP